MARPPAPKPPPCTVILTPKAEGSSEVSLDNVMPDSVPASPYTV
ncbi:hypothetical protein [Fibrobacter sp. UWB3]|nr:hypothetical protein [Fibrobacter sp. UWB3]